MYAFDLVSDYRSLSPSINAQSDDEQPDRQLEIFRDHNSIRSHEFKVFSQSLDPDENKDRERSLTITRIKTLNDKNQNSCSQIEDCEV